MIVLVLVAECAILLCIVGLITGDWDPLVWFSGGVLVMTLILLAAAHYMPGVAS